jgi:predicted nucleotidyltransferase
MGIDYGQPPPKWLVEVAATQPYPLIFATVSGAHLYGFGSVDSDVDLRGVHLLPLAEVVGLEHGPETLQHTGVTDGVELDLVTHDLLKFNRLLLRPNGYVLEQLLSPLVVTTSEVHREMLALARSIVTRHHAHHYLGFAATQWRLFERGYEVKPLLYTLRVLLTGIHLMRTGEVDCDLRRLWAGHDLPYVPELIEVKRTAEHVELDGIVAPERLAADVARLRSTLEDAAAESRLPERPSAHRALHDLTVRTRLATI